MTKILAIDVETTGLEYADRLLTIGLAYRDSTGVQTKSYVIGMADLFFAPQSPPMVMKEFQDLVKQSDVITLHNASFDLPYLHKQNYLPIDLVKGKLLDTLVTARMTAPRNNGLSLESVCGDYKLFDTDWANMKSKRKVLSKLDVETVLKYNELDAKYTLLLAEILWKESVTLYGKEFTLRESDFSRLMAEIRVRGKKIDEDKVHELRRNLKSSLNHINFNVLGQQRILGANDRSGLIRYLRLKGFNSFNLTEKGNEKLDKNEIEELVKLVKKREMREILESVLEARKLEKIVGTYIEPILNEHMDVDGFVHPSYSVGGTTTYRLSSSHPNGQNFPREYSNLIWSPYLSADYSQAELRLAAAYAQEQKLVDAYANARDVHLETAIGLYGKDKAAENRKTAKNINFAILYGGGAKTVNERYQVPFEEAKTLISLHRKLYPRLHRMTRKAQEVWQERGYIELLSGKRLWATRLDLERGYKAFNNLIQGGVAELIKESMLQLDAKGVTIIGQIHDSIEFPPSADQNIIRDVMENVLPDKISKRTNPPIQMKVDIELKGAQS